MDESKGWLLAHLHTNFDDIAKSNLADEVLARNFGDVAKTLEANVSGMKRICSRLRECPLDELPLEILKGLEEAVRKARETIVCGATPVNPISLLDDYPPAVGDAYLSLFRAGSPVMSLAPESRVVDLTNRIREANDTLNKLETKNKEALEENNRLTQANLAQEVLNRKSWFAEEAKQYRSQTCLWGLLALFFAYKAIDFMQEVISAGDFVPDNWYTLISHMLPRMGLFGIFTYGTVWSCRNLIVANHNNIVNRHRHNVAGSFDKIIQGARDEDRPILISKAGDAVFNHQDTGYLKMQVSGQSLALPVAAPEIKIGN